MAATMKAVKVAEDRSAIVKDVPVPENYLPYQILIKVKAVGANPTDWKHLVYRLGSVDSTVGCDASGVIVNLGKDEEEAKYITENFGFQVGDFVTGVVHGCSVAHPENGAFAEYALLDAQLATKFTAKSTDGYEEGKNLGDSINSGLPIDSFEKAASLPVSLYTAVMVLTLNLGKKLDFENTEWQDSESTLMIYGGATGFSQNLLQLNKLTKAFKNVITVASSQHEASLKKWGVVENFDYKTAGFLDDIVKKYPSVKYVLDAVSSESTFTDSYNIAKKLYKDEKITVINLMGWDNTKVPAENRDDEKVSVTTTLLYLALGLDVPFGAFTLPADPLYRKTAIENIPKLQTIVSNGSLKSIAITINEKEGLEGAIDAVEGVKLGKNKGEKFIARI
ncbi:hypothetical protein QEN19_001229 [Hanseniaspora menglaensis]